MEIHEGIQQWEVPANNMMMMMMRMIGNNLLCTSSTKNGVPPIKNQGG